jgi:hypothetical protein
MKREPLMTDQAKIQELFDIEAIKRLKARYCRCIDYDDWAGLRALVADDAVIHLSSGVVRGADAFVEKIKLSHTNATTRTVHHCHMPDITITRDGEASGYWALFDYADRRWADGRREAYQGYGYYAERYRRINGEWKLTSMRLHRIRVDPLKKESFDFPEATPVLAPPETE